MNFKVQGSSVLGKALVTGCAALLLSAVPAVAQNIVKGTVKDASGEALPGVSITLKGRPGTGAVTDANGNFSIDASKGDKLVFTYVGMTPQTVAVGGRHNIDVQLADDESTLNDVVVIGYGKARKASLTGAVSAVRGDELLKAPSTNVSSLLGGRMPGITSVQTSGEPGADQASLRIRGSEYGVLYIVDGVPRSIDDVDPNDIESVSVLKDGAAAAVYGLNSGGGVIIITTRKGYDGKTKVSYDGQYGVSVNANFPQFMNGPEFAHYYNMADMMDKLANGIITDRSQYQPVFTLDNIKAMTNGDPTDGWDDVNYIDKVFGTGTNMKHNVTLQGGTADHHYFVGGGFLKQNGNIDNFNYRRYNLRANLDSKIGRDWKVSVGLVGTAGRRQTPGYASGGADDGTGGAGEVGWLSIGHQAIMMRPYLPQQYDGHYTATIPNNAAVAYSPLAAIYNSGYKKTRSTELRSNFTLEYQAPWLKGLTLKATGAYDYSTSQNKNLDTPYKTYAQTLTAGVPSWQLLDDPRSASETLNHLGEGQYTSEQMDGQIGAEYDRLFGRHHVDAMLMVEAQDIKTNSLGAYVDHVPFAELPELSYGTALKESPVSGYSTHIRRAGYIFRLKYDYANTYLAELSGRYDGSYKFSGNASGKRWGFFPSLSLAWRVTQEKFMQPARGWLNDLKVRASVGMLGNDSGLPEYMYLATYAQGGNRFIGGTALKTLYTSGVPNLNLTWTKIRSSNVGFDATLWDGKLGVEFDWFYNYNYNILTQMGGNMAPSMGGYFSTYENYNRYANYGIEWTLSHRNHFGLGGHPFNYSVALNMTYATNKWLRYPDSPNTSRQLKVVGTNVDAVECWIADGLYRSEEEIDNSAWYGSRPNVGDIKYRDLNGDGKITWEGDRTRTGKSNRPRYMMGLNLAANWNGFDISAQFTAGFNFSVSLLGTYYNGADDNTVWSQTFKEGANSPLWLVQNSYSIDNPTGKYPRITLSNVSHGGANGLASTFWMKKGDYVRLKDFQIGYTLPASITRAAGIDRVRLFVEGSNIFTLDGLPKGIDPESPRVNNGYYPQQRTFLGGINITF